jgi:hypothetical protein
MRAATNRIANASHFHFCGRKVKCLDGPPTDAGGSASKKPKQKRNDDAQQKSDEQGAREGKEKAEMFPFDDNVARQAAEAEPRKKGPQKAGEDEKKADSDEPPRHQGASFWQRGQK